MDELNNSQEINSQQIEYQMSYCKKISTRYEEYSEEALKFVFSPYYQPDVWEDVSEVYNKAIEHYLPLDKHEIPVLFVGANAQNRITRKDHATGFLLTDHMIYVREASMFSDYLPVKYPYPTSTIEAIGILEKAVKSFDWEYLETILSSDLKIELIQLMREAITDILTMKEAFKIAHSESFKSKDVEGRITELGLRNSSCIKKGTDEKQKKHFQKVIKKFQIPSNEEILLAVTDSTIVGPYGLVITDKSIYSKDTLEKPKATDRNKLEKDYPVKIIEDSIILGTNIAHILPSYLSATEKESVKTILQEFIHGEISL